MKSYTYWGILLVVGMAILLESCKFREAEWNTEILAPLVKTRLSLDQVLDEENLEADSSKTLHLVFRKSLYDLSIDSLFHFSDTSSRRTFKIDSLSLYSSTIDYPISLATLARNAGSTGQLLLFLHGTSQIIPPIPPITPAAVPINADTLFTTMTLDQGNLDLSLYNGLPIAITDAQFELRNEMDKSLIVSGSFPFIGPNETVSRPFDLSGKTVEGRLLAQLVSLSSPGSNGVPVLIDTSATINASLKVYNLHPSTATAIWPAQDLINSSYYFRLKGLPVELKESRLKSGTVRITLYSTLEDSVRFSYRLPGATKNGVPLEAFKTLDPAPRGSTSRYVREENMAGYHWDLSGLNGDSFNIAFNEIIGSVDSTGVMKTFSTQDSLYAELAFLDIRPSYARGYLNDTTLFAGPNVVPLDFFNKVRGGRLNLEQAALDIDISNKIGVDMEISINSLKAVNNRTNTTVVLDAVPLRNPINVMRATDSNGQLPIQSSGRRIGLNAQNSNMLEFISNLPDQISYDLELRTNPLGNVSQHRDFIYDGEYMNLNMNLDIPMRISANGLALGDTLLWNVEHEDLSAIKGGTLHAFFDNGFPMDARIEIYLLNAEGAVMDTLMNGSDSVKAAILNAAGLVELAQQTRLDIPLDPGLLNSVLTARKVAVVMTLDTAPVNQFVRILDRYGIDFQLTADFTYSID